MGHRHTAPLKNPQPCSSPPNVAKAGSDVLHIEYERERLVELACPEDPGTAPFSLAPAGDSFLSTQLFCVHGNSAGNMELFREQNMSPVWSCQGRLSVGSASCSAALVLIPPHDPKGQGRHRMSCSWTHRPTCYCFSPTPSLHPDIGLGCFHLLLLLLFLVLARGFRLQKLTIFRSFELLGRTS